MGTDVPCLTTPPPTEERLSRPQAESWSTNTFPKPPKPQNAVTLVSPSVVSRPAVHVNWLSTQRDRRPSAVPMVVPSHLAPSVPASSAFLIEEQKIVVKVLKAKQQAQAAAK